MSALSILFVTSRFPLPLLSGDRARAFHQVRLLSRRHRVTLVTYADPIRAEQTHALLERLGVRVVTVPFNNAAAVYRLARHTWSDVPLQAAAFDSPAMRATIRSITATERFDLAHIQLARMFPLAGPELGIPRVVDLIDALSLNMRRRAAHDRGWRRWAARVDAQRLQHYEHRICAEVDATLVVAPADREAIGSYSNMSVNPNGVDVTSFPLANGPRDRNQLVFTGNLGYFPNVDAVCWFADRVLPLIWREEPAASLTIAGARPHRRVRALAQREPRISVTGHVANLHPYLAAARVSVAPMRAGSGQLLKVLEAMSTGTPVVATTRGLSGIEAVDGEHALVGDTPEAFAERVVKVMRDDRLANRLASSGHALVERLYTWERSVAGLEAIYLKVVASAPTAARPA